MVNTVASVRQFRLSAAAVPALALIVAGCRISDPGTALSAYPPQDEILTKAYDVSFDTPADFFVDQRHDTEGSYTVYHIKDETTSYELCTDSLEEALAWEASDNSSRHVQGEFFGHHETPMYFEVIRDLVYEDSFGNIGDPTSPGFARVFKCSYVNRDFVDRTDRNGFAGWLNERPLTGDVVRDFVEYMWQFTFFWPRRKTVLQSYGNTIGDYLEHTLLIAFRSQRSVDECDLIEVAKWTFQVDTRDGRIDRFFDVVLTFDADLVNGVPTMCEK